MKRKKLVRRIIQYALGLCTMAAGVVLLKRVDLGISPITSVPAAASNVLEGIYPIMNLGNTTTLLHALCVIGQFIIVRRITLKGLLTMFVGVPFGQVINLFMWLFNPGPLGLPLRVVLLVGGLALSGLGVLLIVDADLMLPAPDELSHTISQVYGKKLSNVKIVSDAVYVAIAIAVDLIFAGKITTVGIGTVLSVLLTGRFIGWFDKLFPKLRMEPFWDAPGKKSE